jgi:septal ring-binding cell division protein DamX
MEENNKVVVFEKKEIVLILIFVLILIVTSFTLGIRMGKKLSLTEAGIKDQDVRAVELRSADEEDADLSAADEAALTDDEKLKRLMDESKARLTEELEKFTGDNTPETSPQTAKNPMAGKFTIQLGSYNTQAEARQFAEGFTVRGYSPIINEVNIEGKGKWYRVSLGLFNTVDEARNYIRAEQSLFSGQDHIITEIR